ncbi:hypothetical protein KUCAC02_037922, partial [Chaenocephalus aceratus]
MQDQSLICTCRSLGEQRTAERTCEALCGSVLVGCERAVERILGKCTRGIGLYKTLSLKLSDYLADYHIWISLYSCPAPTRSHTLRD